MFNDKFQYLMEDGNDEKGAKFVICGGKGKLAFEVYLLGVHREIVCKLSNQRTDLLNELICKCVCVCVLFRQAELAKQPVLHRSPFRWQRQVVTWL